MGNLKDTPRKSIQLLNEDPEIPVSKSNLNSDKSTNQVFLQQSVTLLAFKDKAANNATSSGASPKLIFGLFKEDLPIFIGAIIGASLVIVLCLLIFIIWKCCCRMTVLSKKKEYWLEPKNTTNAKGRTKFPAVQRSSVVFLGLKPTQDFAYKREKSSENCSASNLFSASSEKDFLNSTFDDSVSYTMSSQCPDIVVSNEDKPISNGPTILPSSSCLSSSPNQTCSVISTSVLHNGSINTRTNCSILSPIEISIPSVTIHQESPASFHRSFYSGNFDQHSLYSCDSHAGSEVSFRKCSSFTWSNYSLRPASSDCYYDLFQKANFCKKRKNRMRSDIAAAIALNRSQSSQLNKDTELLVENEVEVILAERTTL